MSGHSHWQPSSTRRRIDAKRGKLFSKLSRAIIIAARTRRRPEMNLNCAMPSTRRGSQHAKDNIERAVKRGTGDLDGQTFDEIVRGLRLWRCSDPGRCADRHRNRTRRVRKIFERGGARW